jgi:hypothetical protein
MQAALALTAAFQVRALAAFTAGDLAECARLEALAARAERIADRKAR